MDKFEFEKWLERILKIMKECEPYIGMTLAEAFEKQIPKAPVVHPYSYEQLACPICGNVVTSFYCSDCGQKIDWKVVDNG